MHWQDKSIKELVLNAEVSQEIAKILSVDTSSITTHCWREEEGFMSWGWGEAGLNNLKGVFHTQLPQLSPKSLLVFPHQSQSLQIHFQVVLRQ